MRIDYQRIMRMGPADTVALSARLREGMPDDVRTYILYGVWRSIQCDAFIPSREKRKTFLKICQNTSIEVVNG